MTLLNFTQFAGNPASFVKKLAGKVGNIYKGKIVNKKTKRFINHNKKVWKNYLIKKPTAEILVDFCGIPETIVAYSYFLNVLAKKHSASIKVFSMDNKYCNLTQHKIYRSFNIRGHINPELNRNQKEKKRKLSKDIIEKIKTKRDVFDLHVLDTWIGIDIYETYLRRLHPTIDFNDPLFWKTVDEGISLLIFWQDYFKEHKVAGVIISHDFLNHLNIIAKVAYQNNIPVYLPNARGMQCSDKPHAIYESRFINYRNMFKKLPYQEQEMGILKGKTQLERRFSGEVGVDMHYSTASAFKQVDSQKSVLRKNDKIKVLIATHCFYDNPHGYGGMLFLDFYEWLCFLGEISEKTDYDWYIKTHPDPRPGTQEILEKIIQRYPRFTIIPYKTSFHQLVKEGIRFALTCYGSIGHELPALGIQVINAGYNPHIAYDFNWHPKSIEEYEHLLMNLGKPNKEIDVQQMYEFYYMHYYYTYVDALIYTSHKQMIRELKSEEQMQPKAYEYFLDQLTDVKQQEITNNMQKFIDSGKCQYFSRGPE